MNRPYYYLIGDSLTEYCLLNKGWGQLLQETFGRTSLCIPCGRSGYNSRWINEKFSEIVSPVLIGHPTFVTLLLGSNDCCTVGNQGVSKVEFRSNIENIINKICSVLHVSNDRILLITPPPNEDVSRSSVFEYSDIIRNIAKDYQCHLVDLYSIQWDHLDFVDGLHLSESGNRKLYDQIMLNMPQYLKYDLNRFSWPHWSEMI